nr:hypothetical protein [Tanacetum cinerariifolium]
MDLFSLIRTPNPTKVKTGSRSRAPHELPLLTLTVPRVIEMDEPAATTDSSGVPSAIEKSPLDFADEAEASSREAATPEMPPPEEVPITTAPGGDQAAKTIAVDPHAVRESRKRGHEGIDANAPPKSFQGVAVAGDPESKNVSSPTEVGSPRSVARRDKRIQARELEIENLEVLLETEVGIKRAAEEKSAGLSQELERMWYGLRLATMKCAESLEMRQAFADVVSAGIAKGMSEGLKHGVEHGHTQRTIESLEAYDSEAEAKFAAALQSLKDLKLSLLDQLEGLKDALMDVIMASLYLEDDTRGMLYNLYATSVLAPPSLPSWYTQSRVEQKKRSRIVSRTHRVGSAHHARSDRVPVSAPIVVPQGLALLLVDAATQTDPDDA